MTGGDHILEARGATCIFPGAGLLVRKPVTAVDGVDMWLGSEETLGVVGESGSGKSTFARMMLGLTKPSRGALLYRGQEISKLNRAGRAAYRRDVQVVFQDPGSSLNPRKSVEMILAEVLRLQGSTSARDVSARSRQILDEVGLEQDVLFRMPHELSGGQKQRIAIGRAVAMEPRVIVADEALSSLDVSVQAQILRLMKRLQVERGLSYLFISHDLGVVREIADRVAVMHHGKVVEQGATPAVLDSPTAEYTKSLLAARFVANPHEARRRRLATSEVHV